MTLEFDIEIPGNESNDEINTFSFHMLQQLIKLKRTSNVHSTHWFGNAGVNFSIFLDPNIEDMNNKILGEPL